jgi:hypothetical protein
MGRVGLEHDIGLEQDTRWPSKEWAGQMGDIQGLILRRNANLYSTSSSSAFSHFSTTIRRLSVLDI